MGLDKEDGVDTAIVLRNVGDLSPFTPHDLSGSCDKTKLGNVDLDNRTLGQNTKLGVERV